MPGFCLKSCVGGPEATPALRLLDFGGSGVCGCWKRGPVTATWTYWDGYSQFHIWRNPHRLLWVEGEPDRLPQFKEPFHQWLSSGRWGSFRGIEVRGAGEGPPVITAFVDPLATRPLYYLQTENAVYIADKLGTLAANHACEVEWGPLFEAACLGMVGSGGVSLRNASALRPGQVMEFRGTEAKSIGIHQLPEDLDIQESEVRSRPAWALLQANRKAVAETWTNPESYLLLSGGLDSRFLLALGGLGRKTMTVTTRDNQESNIASQISSVCKAEFVHWKRPYEVYYDILRDGPLLMGGMGDSQGVHHLGLGSLWRRQGIRSITHGFLYDTLLKGFFHLIDQPYPCENPLLASVVGERERVFYKRAGRASLSAADDSLALLSDEGRQVALEHMRTVAERDYPVVRKSGIDLALEQAVLRFLSRQIHYPLMLGWFEEQNVSSPIFHPALWTWFRYSKIDDRKDGKAFREALLLLNHPVCELVDSNTGDVVRPKQADWRDAIRRTPFYGAIRKMKLRVKPPAVHRPATPIGGNEPPPETGSWPHIIWICRTEAGRRVVRQGIEMLGGHSLFDENRLHDAWEQFLAGDDNLLEPALSMMTMGRWRSYVAQAPTLDKPFVKSVPTGEPE